MEKPLKFCLQFSIKDEEQTYVGQILKQLGRHKSSFITKAILVYLKTNPLPIEKNLINPKIIQSPEKHSYQRKKNPTQNPLDINNEPDIQQISKTTSQSFKQSSFDTEQNEKQGNSSEEESELSELLDGLKAFGN